MRKIRYYTVEKTLVLVGNIILPKGARFEVERIGWGKFRVMINPIDWAVISRKEFKETFQ